DAVDDLSARFGNLHHGQDGLQERDQDHAGDRTDIGAAAAEDGRAAEHDGRDGRQQIDIAHGLGRLGGIAGEQDAAEGGKPAGHGEGEDEDPARVDAGEVGGAFRVADAIDGAAEGGAGQKKHGAGADDRPDEHGVGDT